MAFDAPRQALLDASRLLAWNQSRTKENEMNQARALKLTELSRSRDPGPFLKAIFDGLIYDGFRFPTMGNDGCIERCCISKALVVNVPNTTPARQIGFHLNFTCVPGGYDGSTLNLTVTHFHLTARPLTTQALINVAGPSILTAANSIHINRNTDWGRQDNFDAMAADLYPNLSGDKGANALKNLLLNEAYTKTYMSMAVHGLKQAITTTVGVNAGQTRITWAGSDATFS
jgi:hypothetical protein